MKKGMFFLFLAFVLASRTALCGQIYQNSNLAIYNDYPILTFEIFAPKADLLRFAFIKKPYDFQSSDNNFKVDCISSSCRVGLSLASKENLDTKIPFIEQTLSKSTCDELVKKFKSATYFFDNGNLELQFLGRGNCALRYINFSNYSNHEIDAVFEEFFVYKKAEEDKIKNLPGSIKDRSWVKNKLQALINVNQKASSLWFYPEQNKLKSIDKIYFEKTFRKKLPVDIKQTSELKELLNKYNWFIISKFGKEADSNGWLLVWDQYHDIKFQKMVLKRLEKLYPSGETSKAHYAYLYDRVAVSENKPQKYGTIGYCVGKGIWEPAPLEDAKLVDKFRRDVELESMSEYKKRFKETCLQADGSSSTVSLRTD